MRKNIIKLLLILCVLSIFTACGKKEQTQDHEHQWIEASCIAPKTCYICGETEGETIDHDWFEAQCYIPRTCKFCGLEEGEMTAHNMTPKGIVIPSVCTMCGLNDGCLPNYFEVNNIPLEGPIHANSNEPAPEFDQQFISFNNRNFNDFVLKNTKCSISVYAEPDFEDESKMVYTIYANSYFDYREGSRNSLLASSALADLYTGMIFEKRVSDGDDVDSYSATLEIEGVEYEITWTEYTSSDSKTFIVTVPAEYKGLVYCINKLDYITASSLKQRFKESKNSLEDASHSRQLVNGTDLYIKLCE